MKKLLKNTLLFVIIVAVFDYILGTGFTFMRDHAGCGTFQELKYAAEECDDDVLIFGSSRALHHYDPKVISDSLNLSCLYYSQCYQSSCKRCTYMNKNKCPKQNAKNNKERSNCDIAP